MKKFIFAFLFLASLHLLASGGGTLGNGGGIQSINSDSTSAQVITSGSSGTDVAVSSSAGTTTINVPSASVSNRGVVTTGAQTLAGVKTLSSSPLLSSLTATTVPYLDSSKQFASSTVTPTELGYVSGVTSALQTQINAKQASGNYITALTGDVSASGPGSVSASISAATVTGKLLTGFSAGAGTVASTDSILQGFNKVVGNMALLAPIASPTFTGTATVPAGSSGSPGLAVGATGTSFYNCDGVVHDAGSKALCLSTGGTSGAGILAFGNAGGAGIPIIGSPLNSGLAIISGINSNGGIGGIGAEIRIFSRNAPAHGGVLYVANLSDYYSNTFAFGVDDGGGISPFKVGFLGTDGLMVGTPDAIGLYPTVKPIEKLEVYEATAATAVYAKFDSAVTGRTASDGFNVGVDASGNAVLNNKENKDLIILNNDTETVRVTNAGRFIIKNQVTPSTSSDTCVTGTIATDTNFIYVCTATDTWKRAALSTW